jgi:GT2 family glycosyltransferase
MKPLSGKKALCFIALPHHNRFLVPIMQALQQEGMAVGYFTAAAEGAFEITLNQANLAYRHVLDYATPTTKEKVDGALRELRPLLQGKILGNDTLQSVPLVIQDKVIRGAVENFHGLNRMLEVEKPDLLFALHELNPWGKILGYLSHVHRIPYFTLQEGLYYADLHYYRFHTDYSTACVVWGNECREILLKAGCSDDKIYPLGNTHIWDAKKEFTAPAAIERTRARLGVAAGKKIILFLMSHSHYRPFEAQTFLRWMKERGDIVAVFKWHPATGKEFVDRALENFKDKSAVISVDDFDTYALIGASELCVTVGNSTTGLESLVFGKPLLEVRLPDQPYSYSALGVAEQAFGFEDLAEKIGAILARGLPKEMADSVERYLAHNFAYRDDKTMERIVALVKESLAARREAPRRRLGSTAPSHIRVSIILPVDDSAPEALLATLEGIASSSAPALFEVVIVDCAAGETSKAILQSLAGDVKVVSGRQDWSYAEACNQAVTDAVGEYLVFLKPGLVPGAGWLEGLLKVAEAERDVGAVGGQVLDKSGLLWHVGVAFDVNQSPFSIYRFLPREFSGAAKQREFKAVELPFLVSREVFCRLGGFNHALHNRFEDVDFCLSAKREGLRVLYTPHCAVTRAVASWQPEQERDQLNRIRFYSKWTGSLWQDDGDYLSEDGLTHDSLSALYRELAGRVLAGAKMIAGDASTLVQ